MVPDTAQCFKFRPCGAYSAQVQYCHCHTRNFPNKATTLSKPHNLHWILQDRNVSITKRLRYFESVVSSVACFAGGHRTIYNRQLERLDTHFRKLCRSIVGLPPGTDWIPEWHEILHQWNVRVNIFIDRANIKAWSRICCLNS